MFPLGGFCVMLDYLFAIRCHIGPYPGQGYGQIRFQRLHFLPLLCPCVGSGFVTHQRKPSIFLSCNRLMF